MVTYCFFAELFYRCGGCCPWYDNRPALLGACDTRDLCRSIGHILARPEGHDDSINSPRDQIQFTGTALDGRRSQSSGANANVFGVLWCIRLNF